METQPLLILFKNESNRIMTTDGHKALRKKANKVLPFASG